MVLTPRLPAQFLYGAVHPLYSRPLRREGTEVHDLRREPLSKGLKTQSRDYG